ncbi:hypothetical protein U27_05223 [Candidatus Vecturithrix granuli]|uniref:Uncharacterized protein n=1 Tax=Vecturithrix granuli TaxID=1499967 RepID=A0A081C0Z5_VECG1|nr:hypothetical protein U27_05223 [Candidatus Vecturithrix granuli]
MPHYHEAIRTFAPIADQLRASGEESLFLLPYNDQASGSLCAEFGLSALYLPHFVWGRHLTGGVLQFFRENRRLRHFAQQFCDEIHPSAFVLIDDRRYIEAFLVKQAKVRQIPSLVVMWAATNDVENMLIWRQKRSNHYNVSFSEQILRRSVEWFVPQAVKYVDGQAVFWQPPSAILGMRLFAGYPENPWILGGGQADYVAVTGEHYRRILLKAGVNPAKILATGHPRHDLLIQDGLQWKTRERERICQEIGAPAEKRLLLLGAPPVAHITAGTRAGHITADQMNAYLHEVIARLLCLDETFHLVIKVHPRDEAETLPYLQGHSKAFTVIRRYETGKLIAISDLLICQGSTIVFDAHILGTPTLTFDFYQTPGYDMWAKAGGVFHVTRQSDLLPSLRRVLEDSVVRSKLDAERQTFLQEYVRCDGHAAERIARVLQQIIRHKCNDTEGYGHALWSAQALLARPKQSFGIPKNVHNLACQYTFHLHGRMKNILTRTGTS